MRERVNFQVSSMFNWFIKIHERIKSFSTFVLSCFKRFTTKGKLLSHFLEKLLITKAIYNQLNKYNKAWLNTNLTKTLTLYFTVEFQELLQIFWEMYHFNSPKFFTFTCIYILCACKKTKQDFSQALRQNPPGHWVIFIFSGQNSCTRII